jgi:hypothetical protein
MKRIIIIFIIIVILKEEDEKKLKKLEKSLLGVLNMMMKTQK